MSLRCNPTHNIYCQWNTTNKKQHKTQTSNHIIEWQQTKTWPTTPKRRLKIISSLKPTRLHRNPTGMRFDATNMQLHTQHCCTHTSPSKTPKVRPPETTFCMPKSSRHRFAPRTHNFNINLKQNMCLSGIHDSSTKFKPYLFTSMHRCRYKSFPKYRKF